MNPIISSQIIENEIKNSNNLIENKLKMNMELILNSFNDNNKEFDKTHNEYNNFIGKMKVENYLRNYKNTTILNHKIVDYDNKKYIVCKIYSNVPKLFIVDYDNENIINHKWFSTQLNYIGKTLYLDNRRVPLYLHNYVMGKYTFDGKGQDEMYDHINRITSDNRKANLRLVNYTSNNLNQTRKERIVVLPKDCKVNKDNIPKCVWYIQAKIRNGIHHGDGFVVDICKNGNAIKWTSATTTELSLRFKFEQTKKYLRLLKEINPKIFEEHNIESDYNDEALKLAKEYNEILKLSGFKCAKDKLVKINEKNYLKEDLSDLTEKEIELLKNFTLTKNKSKRNTVSGSKLPKDCGITIDMIPKYCYYSPPNATRRTGELFIIDKHPKLTTRDWKTTSSKKVSLKDKFDMLLKKLKELDNE